MTKLKFGIFRVPIIRLGFSILKNQLVAKIEIEELRQWLTGRIRPLERVVDVMTDKDPQNLAQLKLIWESEREPLIDDSLEGVISIVRNKVKDVVTRDGIIAMLEQVIEEDLDGDGNP